ncbi:MAG: hypothetical protein KGJ89_01680 [Patescibacteria group bacterium]|nr:hypothetical protein [Patescibacteria group bacterium]MDE2015588.1 hypothetical protein [Patescibacteria group bacterium]MDE2226646.1 hypothetical protein [Patescibacteria group bacterium]
MVKIFREFFGPRLNGILGFLLRSVVHGIVLNIFWGWFIIPYFPLPKLPLPVAMGIYLMIAFVKRDYRSDLMKHSEMIDYDNEEAVKRLYGIMMMRALSALTAGWLIHLLCLKFIR